MKTKKMWIPRLITATVFVAGIWAFPQYSFAFLLAAIFAGIEFGDYERKRRKELEAGDFNE